MFAVSHELAAASCSQSPVDSIPYAKTLPIQHKLATVWATRPIVSLWGRRLGADTSLGRPVSTRTPAHTY